MDNRDYFEGTTEQMIGTRKRDAAAVPELPPASVMSYYVKPDADLVDAVFACPRCLERRADWLVICADDSIQCSNCGLVYYIDDEDVIPFDGSIPVRDEDAQNASDLYALAHPGAMM